MKNLMLKRIALLLIICLSILTLQSCGSKEKANKEEKVTKVEDKELSSFMLGGIYFLNGYGGTDAVTRMMKKASYKTDAQLISGYKQIFEFAFEVDKGNSTKDIFKSMWGISNKKELLENLNDLKTREHKYKAWDYARIINNASMGYAASFLTKGEVKQIIKEILPLAQQKFKTWKAYYEDFDKGRVDWNPQDDQGTSFEKISKEITTYEKSIYKILPLNP